MSNVCHYIEAEGGTAEAVTWDQLDNFAQKINYCERMDHSTDASVAMWRRGRKAVLTRHETASVTLAPLTVRLQQPSITKIWTKRQTALTIGIYLSSDVVWSTVGRFYLSGQVYPEKHNYIFAQCDVAGSWSTCSVITQWTVSKLKINICERAEPSNTRGLSYSPISTNYPLALVEGADIALW